jgi:hypothetical protein
MDKRFDRLPDDMKIAVAVLKELHHVPDSMALPVVLGVANLAAQAHYDVDSAKYGVRPISLFLVGMAATGARKTTIFNELMVGIERFLVEKRELLKQEKHRFALEEAIYKKEEAKYLKDREANGVFGSVSLPSPPAPVETSDYKISKATLNGIVDTLKSQSFVGLFSSEGGEFFNSHSFQGGKDIAKAVEMSASLTSMWDGTEIAKTTGMEKVKLFNRRVNMLFLLQTETVENFLNNPIFSEQGFVHRILITQTPKYEKKLWDNSPKALEDEKMFRESLKNFHDRTYQLIGKLLPVKTEWPFELEPRVIKQTDDSMRIYTDFYNSTIDWADTRLKHYSGFAERLHEHAIRLAGTIAAYKGEDEISEETALCSLDLLDFFIEQRLQLELGIQNANPLQSAGAQKLAEWFRKNTAWTGTERDLRQKIRWYSKLPNSQRVAILQELLGDQTITVTQQKAKNGQDIFVYAVDVSVDTVDGATP